jgi:hypothetical protein
MAEDRFVAIYGGKGFNPLPRIRFFPTGLIREPIAFYGVPDNKLRPWNILRWPQLVYKLPSCSIKGTCP